MNLRFVVLLGLAGCGFELDGDWQLVRSGERFTDEAELGDVLDYPYTEDSTTYAQRLSILDEAGWIVRTVTVEGAEPVVEEDGPYPWVRTDRGMYAFDGPARSFTCAVDLDDGHFMACEILLSTGIPPDYLLAHDYRRAAETGM